MEIKAVMMRQLDINKKILTLNINWAVILSFIVFWCYGYYGAGVFSSVSKSWNILISIIYFAILILFLWLSHLKLPEYQDAITITKKDIVIFLSYLIVMMIFSISDLMTPLFIDSVYHSGGSQAHGLIIFHQLSYFTDILDRYTFSNILYIFNLITIGMLIILFLVFRKKSFIVKSIIILGAFILFRTVIFIKSGGNPDPHPSFRLFPLWLSSSMLSATNFSFRLPQFLGLICLMWVVQRNINHNLGILKSWLFGLSIGTIPILWHVGLLVEQSIWTAIIWTIFLLAISKYENLNNFNWFRWVSLLSIFALMRISVFIGLIPLFLLFFINNYRNIGIKKLFLLFAPMLSMLPFLLKSIIDGTPATQKGIYNDSLADISSIERVYLAFTTGMAPKIIFNSIMLPWILFLPLAFIPLWFNFRHLTRHFIVLIFFVFACFTFYTISPGLWGTGRYQAEYVIPFVVFGFLNTLTKMNSNFNKIISTVLFIGMISLVCYNLVFKSLLYPLGVPNTLSSQVVCSIDDALKAVKQEGYAGYTLIIGGTYGCFSEILNGFTVSEVRSQFEIGHKTKKRNRDDSQAIKDNQSALRKMFRLSHGIDYKAIKDNQNIKLVLIIDIDQESVISKLISLGFKPWRTFKNDKSGSIVYGMIRDN